MKKEEGATAAASHLPSLTQRAVRLLLSGRTGSQQRSLQTWETLIKYQKRPTIVSSRRPSFQNSTDWPSKTDETNTKMQMSLRTD